MIINESGLVKALKRAYKREGYTLINSGEQITLYTETWYVRADWDKFPVKALATIVEHMGALPTSADALNIRDKEEPQVVMPEMVGSEISGWFTAGAETCATMVPMTFMGQQVYQTKDDGACYAVDALDLDMVERDVAALKEATVREEKTMLWNHEGELVMLHAARPTEVYWAKPWVKEIWAALESVDLHRQDE